MYGQAGLKQKIREQKESFSRQLRNKELLTQVQIESLRNKVRAYESLKWYQKLFIAIKELFGIKRKIL